MDLIKRIRELTERREAAIIRWGVDRSTGLTQAEAAAAEERRAHEDQRRIRERKATEDQVRREKSARKLAAEERRKRHAEQRDASMATLKAAAAEDLRRERDRAVRAVGTVRYG